MGTTMRAEVLVLSQVRMDDEMQGREYGGQAKVDEFHAERMQVAYERWKAALADDPSLPCPLPPPRAYKIGGVYWLTRGFHRVTAMRAAGVERAEFEVVVGGTKGQAVVDAMESNREHTALGLRRPDMRRTFLKWYDHHPEAGAWTDKALGDHFGVDRTTVRRWLKEHDAGRAERTERVGRDGKTLTVGGGTPTHEKRAATPDLSASPESDDDPAQVAPVSPPEGVGIAHPPEAGGRKADEYPADGRFMPHADGAARVAAVMGGVKARLERVRADMRELFGGDPRHPVAARMHYFSTFDGNLTAMIADLAANAPEAVCPDCAGTGVVDGGACGTCGGYGFIDRGTANGLKGRWKETGPRYDEMCKMADLAEVEA